MLVVGLTGGIGAGKSTFAALLAERGAHVIDADRLGHDALRPGRPAWHSVVDQFGDEILVPGSMEIDRTRLAEIVFGDRDKLAALNAIVHPRILKAIADDLEARAGSDEIVVIDAALLREVGLVDAVDTVIVLQAARGTRKGRLTRARGLRLGDVEARMEAQGDPDAGVRPHDIVVKNDGTLDALSAEADRVWRELQARAGRAR